MISFPKVKDLNSFALKSAIAYLAGISLVAAGVVSLLIMPSGENSAVAVAVVAIVVWSIIFVSRGRVFFGFFGALLCTVFDTIFRLWYFWSPGTLWINDRLIYDSGYTGYAYFLLAAYALIVLFSAIAPIILAVWVETIIRNQR